MAGSRTCRTGAGIAWKTRATTFKVDGCARSTTRSRFRRNTVYVHPRLPEDARCECGQKLFDNRKMYAPTGRKAFAVLAVSCVRCGRMRPLKELGYKEREWVRRFNDNLFKQWTEQTQQAQNA